MAYGDMSIAGTSKWVTCKKMCDMVEGDTAYLVGPFEVTNEVREGLDPFGKVVMVYETAVDVKVR